MKNMPSDWVSYTLHVHVENNRKIDNWLIHENSFNIVKPVISKNNIMPKIYER